jgi:hypothetical protein
MELEQQLFVLPFGVLALTSSIFGVKFVGKSDYLPGVVWLVVALAGASIVVYALGDVDAAYSVAYFCDAFLRGRGGPAIMIPGLMAVTHGYRPLPYVDLYLFGGATADTAAQVVGDAGAQFQPAFYLCMWSVLSCCLAYLAWRLAQARAYRHALGVGLVLRARQPSTPTSASLERLLRVDGSS